MDFVIIGNSWDASRDNPTSKHHVALQLAGKGHKVLWVDGAGMRRPSLSSGGDRSRILSKLKSGFRPAEKVHDNIWRVSPLIVPLPSSALARRINDCLYLRAIRRGVKAAGLCDPVLINFLPTIPGVMGAWGRELTRKAEGGNLPALGMPGRPEGGKSPSTHSVCSGSTLRSEESVDSGQSTASSNLTTQQPNNLATIYYCVDRWDQFAEYDAALMERLDAECCRSADLVIASAQDLYERCKRHNENTVLLPHGVDHAHFATALEEKNISRTEATEGDERRLFTGRPGRARRGSDADSREERDSGRVAQGEESRKRGCLTTDDTDSTDGERGEDGDRSTRAKHGARRIRSPLPGGRTAEKSPSTHSVCSGSALRSEEEELGVSSNSTTQQPDNLATADASLRRIGFFGLISEWVDQELLVQLAKIENCEVVLAGKADVDAERLSAIKNIKMIGSVPYRELPELVATFDVGIIPFEVNELTKAVNPIKLREMLAAGCRVVSMNLPEVKKVAAEMPAGAVNVAEDRAEFVRMVRDVLRSREQGKLISDAVKDQDWSAKVEEILRLIGGGEGV